MVTTDDMTPGLPVWRFAPSLRQLGDDLNCPNYLFRSWCERLLLLQISCWHRPR